MVFLVAVLVAGLTVGLGGNGRAASVTVAAKESLNSKPRSSVTALSNKTRLKVAVSGLPRGVRAKLSVAGPLRFKRTVNVSKTFKKLRKGKYVVRATTIRSGRYLYNPSRKKVTKTVKTQRTSKVTLTFVRRLAPSTKLPSPRVDQTPGGLSMAAFKIANLNNVKEIWVSASGNNSNPGTQASPVRTVAEAWNRIPQSISLSQPYRIQIRQGTYSENQLPNYWENRFGTKSAPVVFNSVDGKGKAVFGGDINLFNSKHVYFTGINISRNADTFHCERCSYVLLRDMKLNGDATPGGAQAHETIKVNQSDHVYIENSEISGAGDNAIDFVAVQYGHVLGSKISKAGDWCAYAKGGSAYVTFANNEVYDCGTGGITVGQGTGFEFMTSPWIYYEGTGVYVVNNVIHDTQGAALGVNGGYNVLMAYNTSYRVGTRSHGIEFVHGMRGCDGNTSACASRQQAGGWGTTGAEHQYIPNKHVYFYNNVLLNPNGVQSAWNHFQIAGTTTPPSGSNVPSPSRADQDLRIVGNVIKNGPSNLSLVGGGGCQNANPTCGVAQLKSQNVINDWTPTFVNAPGGNFTPTGQLADRDAVPIPDFTWSDVPGGIWSGGVHNGVPTTKTGATRDGWGRPGAQ